MTKAYKFRNLQNLDRIRDLIDGTLWAADWQCLNDPMEGMFSYTGEAGRLRDRHVTAIRDQKLNYGVVSLAGTWRSPLLWAHYADEFRGVAIEFELPRLDEIDEINSAYGHDVISLVDYRSGFEFDISPYLSPVEAARQILLSKQKCWKYEREIRILARPGHYKIGRSARRIIVGTRTDKAELKWIRETCRIRNIECLQLVLGKRSLQLAAL